MTAFLRLLTLAASILILVGLSAHRMDASQRMATSTAVAAMAAHQGHSAPVGPAERGACQVHCLAASVPASTPPPTPAMAGTGSFAFGAPVRLDGLSPPPLGPPPKLPAFA